MRTMRERIGMAAVLLSALGLFGCNNLTGAEGVGVVAECRHLCMMMRGVEKQNSVMTTSSVLGSFHDDAPTRAEFIDLISPVRGQV